ncbi:MAG TPA: class I SAM-dependent methyltransferase [bacterium]|nr:class I SAM-dependent methyltransferase [bacterium]HPN81663.1 class I SAM-dependent methyltransferase [bacterium]HPW39843.1 class I SAM-dependent methyltransferase [bacterium]
MRDNPLKKYYNEVRTDYGINSLRRRKILALAGSGSLAGQRILDVGCASGYLAKELKQPDNFVAGLDISEKFINELQQRLDAAWSFDLERDDWPPEFIDNKFDLIICAEVLEHLFDIDGSLQRLKEVLKSDGKIIISTPNFLLWNNRIRMLLGRYGEKEIFYDWGHIHLMSYNGLKDRLVKNNFNILAEDNIWYPNKLERMKKFLPPNLFVFQSIIKIENK